MNGTVDNIDLALRSTSGQLLALSADEHDNKERVIFNVGLRAVKLRITGTNVTGDETGCGTNKMKIYYAWYYEDTARDDAERPGAEIDVY